MKWKMSLIIILAVLWLGVSSLDQQAYAQQTDQSAQQDQEDASAEAVESTDENFVPTETINVDTEISFPVDI